MTKITISQEGSNPISITLSDESKTLFKRADFKDIPQNYWAKKWIYVKYKPFEGTNKELYNNGKKYAIFDYDKPFKTKFEHKESDVLEEFKPDKNLL